MRNRYRDANPIWMVLAVIGVIALALVGGYFAYQYDQRWQHHCTSDLGGEVQTQTWTGYGFHTDAASGKMVYGHYSTSTTVCRLVRGPLAGAIVDTE